MYFSHSYAIFPPSYAIFLFLPPVTLFLPFSPQFKLLNSIAAKIAQDIYYKKKKPSYAISTYARFFEDTMIA